MKDMLRTIAALGNHVAGAIDWHCVALWAEAVGYGLALLAVVVLRFRHRLHLVAYGMLLALKVVHAMAAG
jgi:hypothetical protein